jgi:2-hydroxy-3-oxopropionate reductase
MTKIGFIGLGIMGSPMAGHLVAAGHELSLFSRGGVPIDLCSGGHVCKSGAEAARRSDVVIIMVPDTPDVEAVLFAADGVAAGLSPGKMVIDMSSSTSASPMAAEPMIIRPWCALEVMANHEIGASPAAA